MEFKYQVILLGTLGHRSEDIVTILFQQIEQLSLPNDAYKIIRKNEFESDYIGNQPAYVLYFGNSESPHEDTQYLSKLLKDGNMVLPIFNQSFSAEIPKVLENQNGLKFDKSKEIVIANLILEAFGKLRNSRKVFISYKRNQSTSVAIQLFEALEKANFDVFLDTHSIKQGEPFQEELWHRMTDVDVVVLLNTSKFLESNWCEQEIAECSARRIGVVQLIWPDHRLERMAEICFPTQLYSHDFHHNKYDEETARLTEDVVTRIVLQVESVRARNLASRQDVLITNFLNFARHQGKNISLQPQRYIRENLSDKEVRLFIPLVGIPQSIDCEQSLQIKKEIAEHVVNKVCLIYDDLRIRQRWLKHLDYLNAHLNVETIPLQNFEKWLRNN